MYLNDKLPVEPEVQELNDLQKELLRTRNLLEKGWCKYRLFESVKGQIRYCILGAIRQIGNGSWVNHHCIPKTVGPLLQALNERYSSSRYAIVVYDDIYGDQYALAEYNNHEGTNKADILSLVDRAIEIAATP